MAKFLAIKLIVMFTFYQSFVVCDDNYGIRRFRSWSIRRSRYSTQFEALEGRVIHGTVNYTCPSTTPSYLRLLETQYWTETNISNGLSALTICVEVRFSFTVVFLTVVTHRSLVVNFLRWLRNASPIFVWTPRWFFLPYTWCGRIPTPNINVVRENRRRVFGDRFGIRESELLLSLFTPSFWSCWIC